MCCVNKCYNTDSSCLRSSWNNGTVWQNLETSTQDQYIAELTARIKCLHNTIATQVGVVSVVAAEKQLQMWWPVQAAQLAWLCQAEMQMADWPQ